MLTIEPSRLCFDTAPKKRKREAPAAKTQKRATQIGGKMAVTRSIAARARLFDLLALPDDLLLKVARHALAIDLPAALSRSAKRVRAQNCCHDGTTLRCIL